MDTPPEKHASAETSEVDSEATARAKARELKALTDEEALRQIELIVAPESYCPQPGNWSGLIEQQAIFHKHRKTKGE